MKFIDQMGYEVSFSYPPNRIISLVPSQTELLFDLKLDERVVGVTKFCIHPKEKAVSKPKVGGTKKLDFQKIHLLKPDLILANKEENYLEGIEELKISYPVWISNVSNVEQALKMINAVGLITGSKKQAQKILFQIKNSFEDLPLSYKGKALYMIWKKPYMAAGGGTIISEMMNLAGYTNILQSFKRYPVFSAEEIVLLQPEFILLSSEPFPFQEKHLQEFSTLCPAAKILIVDGEMFSWFGSRMLKAAEYFRSL